MSRVELFREGYGLLLGVVLILAETGHSGTAKT